MIETSPKSSHSQAARFGGGPEIARQAACRHLEDRALREPGGGKVWLAGELCLPFGMRNDGPHPLGRQPADQRAGIDERVVRKLQQQVSAAVGEGEDLVADDHRRNALVDADVAAWINRQGNALGGQGTAHFVNRVANGVWGISAVIATELMRGGDNSSDSVVGQCPAEPQCGVNVRRTIIEPPAGNGSGRPRRRWRRSARVAPSGRVWDWALVSRSSWARHSCRSNG